MDGAVRKYTYHRILGYVVTILVHVSNIVYLKTTIRGVVEKQWDDKRLKTFSELQGRYFTGWTIAVQVLHAITGLVCEMLVIWNLKRKNYQLPKYLRGFRDTLFCAVLFPTTLLVTSLFWSLYTYDRGLIFPTFVDKILTTTSNHILHTLIVPLALWEVFYQPRFKPGSHSKYIGHLVFHMLLYLSVLIYTYVERGIWVYPVFKRAHGTIYFPGLIVLIGVLLYIYYYLHWLLVSVIWGSLGKKDKNSKKLQ